MPWAIKDACDYVRPNALTMNYKYTFTEGINPTKGFETLGTNSSERMNNYEGLVDVLPEEKTNEFKYFTNPISRKEDLSRTINSIQERIARAQKVKGNLCLNNGNAYGSSWKTPELELKLKQMHGGATAQRFYTKFPIYRERAHDKPDVTDDI